jgi:hypothetical protein
MPFGERKFFCVALCTLLVSLPIVDSPECVEMFQYLRIKGDSIWSEYLIHKRRRNIHFDAYPVSKY